MTKVGRWLGELRDRRDRVAQGDDDARASWRAWVRHRAGCKGGGMALAQRARGGRLARPSVCETVMIIM